MKEKLFCMVCNKPLTGNQKKYCSGACKQKHHYDKVKDQTNTYHHQTIRAFKRKLEAIEKKGGKCSICGYNKNIGALEFHHLDPSEKEIQLDARSFANTNQEKINNELKKCILLCSNCHKELHYPEFNIEHVKNIVNKKHYNQGVVGSCPTGPTNYY